MKEIIELNYIDTIIKLLNNAKEQVSKSINMTIVYTYYEIGKEIINQEQKGKNRAKYGEEILNILKNSKVKNMIINHRFGGCNSDDELIITKNALSPYFNFFEAHDNDVLEF